MGTGTVSVGWLTQLFEGYVETLQKHNNDERVLTVEQEHIDSMKPSYYLVIDNGGKPNKFIDLSPLEVWGKDEPDYDDE